MTNIKFLVFFLFVVLTGCSKKESCDEYPDECEKLKREWEIESYTVNGIDSLPYLSLKDIYCTTYKFEVAYNNYYFIGTGCNGNTPSHEFWGQWIYGGDPKIISMYFINDSNDYSTLFVKYQMTDWNVSNLTSDKLWLKSTYKYKTYELHFKAK